jgi:hypothetical protein
MAYDLHVVRSSHWMEASSSPITKIDVDALIEGDPELAWSGEDFVDMADENGNVTRYYMILWNDYRVSGGFETRFCAPALTTCSWSNSFGSPAR